MRGVLDAPAHAAPQCTREVVSAEIPGDARIEADTERTSDDVEMELAGSDGPNKERRAASTSQHTHMGVLRSLSKPARSAPMATAHTHVGGTGPHGGTRRPDGEPACIAQHCCVGLTWPSTSARPFR
nr:MAG: hypothetical protein DIU78_23110 [Pseudomonadota bacterium]